MSLGYRIWKIAGATPTMVYGMPSSIIDLADDRRVAAEAVAPEVLADDHEHRGAAPHPSALNIAPMTGLMPSTSKNCQVTACPGIRSASPPLPVSVRPPPAIAAIDEKRLLLLAPVEEVQRRDAVVPEARSSAPTASTRRSGWVKGSGRRSAASTRLNIALLAPMPTASTTTVTRVNPGARRSERAAYRRSRQMDTPLRRRRGKG